jgi:hypothetical protein
MKEPTSFPAMGYCMAGDDITVERHVVTRYGVLDESRGVTIAATGPDGRQYWSSPDLLHDSAQEAVAAALERAVDKQEILLYDLVVTQKSLLANQTKQHLLFQKALAMAIDI